MRLAHLLPYRTEFSIHLSPDVSSRQIGSLYRY